MDDFFAVLGGIVVVLIVLAFFLAKVTLLFGGAYFVLHLLGVV